MTTVTDQSKVLALCQEVLTLLEKGAIEPVDPLSRDSGFYSTYFIIPKKGGGLRPILDLRPLNKHLKVLKFRMFHTTDVLQGIRQDEAIDLEDAYFHVPIAPHHRQFLHFAFEGLTSSGCYHSECPWPPGCSPGLLQRYCPHFKAEACESSPTWKIGWYAHGQEWTHSATWLY